MATYDPPSAESKSSSEQTKALESESRLMDDHSEHLSSPDGALKTVDVQQEALHRSSSTENGNSTLTSVSEPGRNDAVPDPQLAAEEFKPSAAGSKAKGVAPKALESAGKLTNTSQKKNKGDHTAATKRASQLDKITGDILESKVMAWHEAMTAEINSRYKHEESRIQAWEDLQKAKASIVVKKEEMRQERRRLRFVANMENEIARTHRKAQELKQAAYSKKEVEVAQLNAEAEHLKETGKILNGCFSL
ncbi:hypothetical protein O6H91_21G003500 [Diphasiastrum complanatum]|uniref:Uncharacterized protein n=1 Tax=Diphasiastrum complanatum TaxID=34168 RepID=A0ACC2AH54_DIPCM|nr:hypothetical protein O6H91_21G003500 [Diphasiastrum complanatum]